MKKIASFSHITDGHYMMLLSRLEESGIRVHRQNENIIGLLPHVQIALDGVQVVVADEDEALAAEIWQEVSNDIGADDIDEADLEAQALAAHDDNV